MSGDVLYGVCDKCGKETNLIRHCDEFEFPCECHSPHHFILHDLCEDCYKTFRDDPEKMTHFEVTVDTFNLFMKAHAYYYPKNPERKMTFKDLNPEYFIKDRKAYIRVVCTYDMLVYLNKIYIEYRHYLKEEWRNKRNEENDE